MENQNNSNSGFVVKNITLIENFFHRVNNIAFGKDVKNDLNVDVGVSVNDKTITVIEEVSIKQVFQEKEQVNIKVKMVGVFELIGESPISDLKEFGNINGAAIIFPYIREHITSLSLKGGIGPIILPPVNFTDKKK